VDNSFFAYFFQAGPVVKIVLLLLVVASIASWTFIFQRGVFLRRTRQAMEDFEALVWNTEDLGKLYQAGKDNSETHAGLEPVFYAGFKAFLRTRRVKADGAIDASFRAMRVAQSKLLSELEKHLPLLATIGSISPYVGLFGTVWGIMIAFHSLSGAEQVSIAMVAPGIAEALVATAMGLFAAIPAVIAYNRYANIVDQINERVENFQEELGLLLSHALYQEQAKDPV
jgi:biopolymer transport protein TolQ